MRKLKGVILLAGLIGTVAGAQQPGSTKEYVKDGRCHFDIEGPGPGNGPERATLSLRYSDRFDKLAHFKVEYRAKRIPKSKTADDWYEFDIHIETETGRSEAADSFYGGIYPNGSYVEIIPGEWAASSDIRRIITLLKNSRYVYVVADGERYGPFDTGAKGRAGQSLEACAARNR